MKKQSRTTKFRVLILTLTLIVTIFIIVLAWFSNIKSVDADGMSVVSASGLGLEASFDNLTFSTSIARTATENFKFPLITGDGSSFFIPKLNRSVGSPLTNSDGSWLEKREAVAASYGTADGDYYVEDIYFRSKEELEVYLTNQSALKPLDDNNTDGTLTRKSDYGSFSKDNIAGAARVAFFNVSGSGSTETETPVYAWIPNEKYQLSSSDNFTPISSTVPVGGQGSFNPNDPVQTFGLGDTSKYTAVTDKWLGEIRVKKTDQTIFGSQSNQMYKVEGTTDTYIGAITIYSTTDVDHAINISTEQCKVYPDDYNTKGCSRSFTAAASHDGTLLNVQYPDTSTDQWINGHFDGTFNIGDDQLVKLSVTRGGTQSSDDFFATNDRFQVLIEYCPSGGIGVDGNQQLQVVGFVFYNSDENSSSDSSTWKYNGFAGIGPGDTIIEKYTIDSGSTVVIANNTTSLTDITYGITANQTSTSAVKLLMTTDTSSGTSIIVPQNPQPSQLYSVSHDESADTYTFKSLSTGKYLAIEGGAVVLSTSASPFTLHTGTVGPMLKSGGYYITYSGGRFGVSNTSENANLQIYQGTAFDFTKNGATEIDSGQNYTYYKAGQTSLSEFTKATSSAYGYLLTTELETKPVVALVKQSDGYYTAHIRVKIWVEGTDREAKIPLAGGKFSTHLAFHGQKKSTTT